jgi:hypothetical protein
LFVSALLPEIQRETVYIGTPHWISPFIRIFDVEYDLIELLRRICCRPSGISYFVRLQLPDPFVILNRTFAEA